MLPTPFFYPAWTSWRWRQTIISYWYLHLKLFIFLIPFTNYPKIILSLWLTHRQSPKNHCCNDQKSNHYREEQYNPKTTLLLLSMVHVRLLQLSTCFSSVLKSLVQVRTHQVEVLPLLECHLRRLLHYSVNIAHIFSHFIQRLPFFSLKPRLHLKIETRIKTLLPCLFFPLFPLFAIDTLFILTPSDIFLNPFPLASKLPFDNTNFFCLIRTQVSLLILGYHGFYLLDIPCLHLEQSNCLGVLQLVNRCIDELAAPFELFQGSEEVFERDATQLDTHG